MDAIKLILFVFLVPLFLNAQKTKFPRDTIFINYETGVENVKLEKWIYNKEKGILFNIKDNEDYIMLFYNYKSKTDTLPISKINEYETIDLKEINKKEMDYYLKRFGRQPWIKNKNSVFHTFVIEVISKDKFVIYPVFWRNEGVID